MPTNQHILICQLGEALKDTAPTMQNALAVIAYENYLKERREACDDEFQEPVK